MPQLRYTTEDTGNIFTMYGSSPVYKHNADAKEERYKHRGLYFTTEFNLPDKVEAEEFENYNLLLPTPDPSKSVQSHEILVSDLKGKK